MKEYIKVAAKWWADGLRNLHCGICNIDLFETSLAQAIEKETSRCPYFSITTDTYPCTFLTDIAKSCGISPRAFPWKVIMNFNRERVSVSCGYGVKPEVLYNNNPKTEAY